jgi:hypothetical protein
MAATDLRGRNPSDNPDDADNPVRRSPLPDAAAIDEAIAQRRDEFDRGRELKSAANLEEAGLSVKADLQVGAVVLSAPAQGIELVMGLQSAIDVLLRMVAAIDEIQQQRDQSRSSTP